MGEFLVRGMIKRGREPLNGGFDGRPSSCLTENVVDGADMMLRLQQMMREELTEKPRRAMIATAVKRMLAEEAARRMDTNRNALYKLMHDIHLRLKRKLAKEGLYVEDLLAIFEKG
jgi:DNA-directed RNA polymerase specialized sigma24 family protein